MIKIEQGYQNKHFRDAGHNIVLMMSVWLLLSSCTNMLLQPMETMIRTPADIGMEYDDITLSSQGGISLHGWYLPTDKEPLGTVLFFHGNAENISTHIASVYWLPSQGYNVFLIDYRGYGRSSGAADIDGVHLDVKAAIEFMIQRKQKGQCLVVLGQSLGGALVARTLGDIPYQDIDVVVLDSTFSDYRRITRDVLDQGLLTWPVKWPASWLISNRYRPDTVIGNISPTPILIIHSKKDEVIPLHHALTLYDNAKEPKELWVLENGGHIASFVTEKGRYRKKFLDYLKTTCPK